MRVLGDMMTTLDGSAASDEFVIMLAHSTAAQAVGRIGALTDKLAAIRIGGTADGPQLTLSVGATEWSADDEPGEMISRADSAMYQAKRAGKNRVEIVKRPTRSKLFHNGRPVVAAPESAPAEAEVPLPLRKAR